MQPTHESQEDYLESVLIVTMRKGSCRSVDLAAEMGVTKPSVSVAVGRMKSEGYLEMDEDHLLHLTPSGQEIAQRVYDKHVTLKAMLETIGVAPDQADQEACRMEHVISDDTIHKIKQAIQTQQKEEQS